MLDWLAGLVSPLNQVAFSIGAEPVSWAELLGFVTGAICVFLVVRANVHNFWTGILNAAMFLVLFASARLWADAALQVIYIVLGFVGWWQWLHGGRNRTALTVGRASKRMLLGCAAFVVVGTSVLTPILTHAHDTAPFLDALTTSLSLAAQFLLNAKKVQSWWFWIAADVIYIPLYFAKGLLLTGVVYIAFLALAITGLVQWRRLEGRQPADLSTANVTVTTGTAAVPAPAAATPTAATTNVGITHPATTDATTTAATTTAATTTAATTTAASATAATTTAATSTPGATAAT